MNDNKYQNGSFRGFAQGLSIAIGTAALVAWLQSQFGPIIALGGLASVGSIVLYQIGISNGANVAMNAIDRFVDAFEIASSLGATNSKIALEEAKANRKIIEADVDMQKKQNTQALDMAKQWANDLADARDGVRSQPLRYSQRNDFPESDETAGATPGASKAHSSISFVD